MKMEVKLLLMENMDGKIQENSRRRPHWPTLGIEETKKRQAKSQRLLILFAVSMNLSSGSIKSKLEDKNFNTNIS